MRTIHWCLLFLVLTACGRSGGGVGPAQPPLAQRPPARPQPSQSLASQPNAVARNGCGPADGPAIDVRIFDQVATCATVKTAEPRASVGIWSGELPQGDMRLDGNGGSASLCDQGECQELHGAELVVRERHADGWSGVLRWTDAGVAHELPIRAIECPSEPIMCG